MNEERFEIDSEEFEKKILEERNMEKWESDILTSYFEVLQHKVNQFYATLDDMTSEIEETVEKAEKNEWTEKTLEQFRTAWRMELCMAIHNFYGWGSISLADFERMLRSLSTNAKNVLSSAIRKAISWLLKKVIDFFKNVKTKNALQVQSWSVGGGVGFPFNIGINISVSFQV